MNTYLDHFKVSLKRAKTHRDRTLVALVFAVPHLTLDDLANLHVDQARRLAGHDLAGQVVRRLLADRPDQDLVFPSQKGKALPARHGLPAKPARPATRQTLWRVLTRTVGTSVASIRRMIVGDIPPPPVPEELVDRTVSPRVLPPTLSEGLKRG